MPIGVVEWHAGIAASQLGSTHRLGKPQVESPGAFGAAIGIAPNKEMTMKCQLVPIDFSHDSEHAVDCAIGLAKQFQARLTLLRCTNLREP